MGAIKLKTSVSLSQDVLEEVDRVAGEPGQRSAIIEEAVVQYLRQRRRRERDERDIAIINASAEELNREAAEFLELQVDLFEGADDDEEG